MRVELYGNFGSGGSLKTIELDENFQGLSTFDEPHSGQYRVKRITNVRIYADHLAILADLCDGDKNSELPVAAAEEK